MRLGDTSAQQGCEVRGPFDCLRWYDGQAHVAQGFEVTFEGEPPASFAVCGREYTAVRDPEATPASPTVWLDFGDGPEVAGTLANATLFGLPEVDEEGRYALLLMRREV